MCVLQENNTPRNFIAELGTCAAWADRPSWFLEVHTRKSFQTLYVVKLFHKEENTGEENEVLGPPSLAKYTMCEGNFT